MSNPTIDQVFNDWRVLDSCEFTIPDGVSLVSHEEFTSAPEIVVRRVLPNCFVRFFGGIKILYSFFYAFQLLFSCGRGDVLLVDGSNGLLWFFVGYLHKLPFFKRTKIFLWDLFVEYHLGKDRRLRFFPMVKIKVAWKISFARFAMMEYDVMVLWSRKQVEPHAKLFRLPKEKFIFLPFKSDHSVWQTYDIPMGNFIFAGGNSKRDYKTLVEAVRGTGIPTIISTTDPNVKQSILQPAQIQKRISAKQTNNTDAITNQDADAITNQDDLADSVSNVIVLAASEPAFAQLQAASRFVVMPTIYSGLKGTSEANFCNPGWHGKPVIACCDIAAEDYIVEGETGYVVHSGDSEGLRKRIIELWNDSDKVKIMGQKGREHVEKYFTQTKFIRRLLRLALLIGDRK
ncbi:MAG: hypothetical protein LBQ66_05510 [Planctomycetaceae bacterium]|nr:hypothetical protein [Planctomycetaceae bacterium]